MIKGLFAALTVVGLILLGWGIQSYMSFGSEVKESLTGAPSDQTIWLIAGGVIASLVGVFGIVRQVRTL